jgi:hypothetical protein
MLRWSRAKSHVELSLSVSVDDEADEVDEVDEVDEEVLMMMSKSKAYRPQMCPLVCQALLAAATATARCQ